MATFDATTQRLCVRVVYDGVAGAGKTTNVRRLAELFATQRASEPWASDELDGRTLYFDWLEIAAGMVAGFPLLCQVITVPGQVVLTPRRAYLLSTADVIVHVVDSELHAVDRAARGLATLGETRKNATIPLVVQANKQDQAGALSGASLVERLGFRDVPVVEAIAADGVGVVDTFVTAVRAIVRSIQARIEADGLKLRVCHRDTPGQVVRRVALEEVDGDWAFEMMLEEAANAFVLDGALEPRRMSGVFSPTLPTGQLAASSSSASASAFASLNAPVLPTDGVPAGFIWPAHTGRAVLRSLTNEPAPREGLRFDEAGKLKIELRDVTLTTSVSARYATAELARAALVRAARERSQLGPLLAPETVLVAQLGSDTSTWIWTVLPRASVLSSALGDREAFSVLDVAKAYGEGVAVALAVELLHELPLELSLGSYGLRRGSVFYLGDTPASLARDPAQALLSGLAELATEPEALEAAVVTLVSSLRAKLPDDLRALLVRRSSWELPETAARGPLGAARDRIVGALVERRSAA